MLFIMEFAKEDENENENDNDNDNDDIDGNINFVGIEPSTSVTNTPQIIASFDIGIKNLAYCIIKKQKPIPIVKKNGSTDVVNHRDSFEIIDWNVIDLMNTVPLMNCSRCKKRAIFIKKSVGFCQKHCCQNNLILTEVQLKRCIKYRISGWNSFLKKHNIHDIRQEDPVAIDVEIEIERELLCRNEFFIKINESKNANEIDLITLGRTMIFKLDDIFGKLSMSIITEVRIENQIGPIATRMKALQGMLTQYFLMRYPSTLDIKYLSSTLKLKQLDKEHLIEKDKDSSTYKDRKRRGIVYTEEILNKNGNVLKKWLLFFQSYGIKKDDLADCFLQGLI